MDPLPREALRWRCDPATLPFETTAELTPLEGVIGQGAAVEALRFGIECDAPGQNVFVRGLVGTGRMTLVAQLLEEIGPTCPERFDHCYVRNFDDPRRPRLITLPAGSGRGFKKAMHTLAEFIGERLDQALEDDAVHARTEALEKTANERIEELTEPLRKQVEAAGLALVSVQAGAVASPAVFPMVEGAPVPPEELQRLRAADKIPQEEFDRLEAARAQFEDALRDVLRKVRVLRREHVAAMRLVGEEVVRTVLGEHTEAIREQHPQPEVAKFLDGVLNDVVEHRLGEAETPDPESVYGVNLVHDACEGPECPVIIETAPLVTNLLGTIDRAQEVEKGQIGDHLAIRGGSLLQADRGYLVMEVRDLIAQEHSWQSLVRTLRAGLLEIVPPEVGGAYGSPLIKPDPIPVKVRVILLGDEYTYAYLEENDPEFAHLFKVLADFRTVMPRTDHGIGEYAAVLARIARDEKLLPLHRDAVAQLIEHGARIAARRSKLTARLGRVADLAREASYLARKRDQTVITDVDVREAVRRTKTRAAIPSLSFQEMVDSGVLVIQTRGAVVGQINGLAVMHAGPLTYGFPARITATVGPGNDGVVDIEQQARLSGAIHTKGFHILRGLLRYLLGPDHPLQFSASLAFEQSYGGIDGDSASGAEFCCFVSALTGVPIRQGVAMTGAIDQHGHVQAIGGVNEKVEGFYDTCAAAGLTGDQGVIIPASNSGDLMLRSDVVDACGEGRFSVWVVGSVIEALEILTDRMPGECGPDGVFQTGSVLGIAQRRVRELWLASLRKPVAPTRQAAPGKLNPRTAEPS